MNLQAYKKKDYLYINLWKHLTYPTNHPTDIKQVEHFI